MCGAHLAVAEEHIVKAVVRAWDPFTARGVSHEEKYDELQNCRIARNLLSVHMAGSKRSIAQGGREDESSACRAKTKVTVESSEAKPYENANPKLLEILISEKFSGGIDGESTVRALQVQRDDKSASMVSMQRFTGTLGGRQGTFVLQGKETVEDGKIEATWSVVPGSGTGNLSGLRGEGGFEGDFGKGSDGWLDYWLEGGSS
jgi:hypothetical protein